MEQILVYSDSLSWGIIPNTRLRLGFNKRWPGVLESKLKSEKYDIRIIENCLNGRRTVWSDPYKDGRDGSQGLAQVIEINSPLKLVILMLGHNDFQTTHDNNAWLSAQGMVKLIQIIRQAPIEPEMPVPEILVVAPPEITKPQGAIAHKFEGAEIRSAGLHLELCKISQDNFVNFYDSNAVITCSKIDGIHLDEDQHVILGDKLAQLVPKLISLN